MMVCTPSLVPKSDSSSESSKKLVRNTNSGPSPRPTELESPSLRHTRLNKLYDLYFVSSTCGNFPLEESPASNTHTQTSQKESRRHMN